MGRTEFLTLIYKGWRKSGGSTSIPIIFPIYIKVEPGEEQQKADERTKAAVRWTRHGSGSERGNRYIARLVRYYYSSDVQITSSAPSRPSVMHCVPSHTAPNPCLWPYIHRTQIYVCDLSYGLLPRDILCSIMKTRVIHVPRIFHC